MSKAYSNKALPAGTILREWRLEQVLGVGGFGIVYKGRGIYFDEMVAIKEYFPSSISERDEDATVVPIDSDAEEVHALGLKKFVEEAKLLWNLSTPTRHPNIVSVRSLFEIHGTAYMVMDFEDGISLSKMIKQGTQFNEASLTNLIRPIAEGLERAHRVGVLHRDIKPPNILVNDDGRSVLIDFGSARFESGEATSTTVTFHTPPYAAIEQYVKTYEQGPWTDIYALGVVMYECITGEKPPEVLERMHGGLGKTLVSGNWPGFGRKFLTAVDAAMTIKPTERPQSISKWLEMFDEPAAGNADEDFDDDEDATRIASFLEMPEEDVPLAPEAPALGGSDSVETAVPNDPAEVKFVRAGEDTNASKKVTEISPPPFPVPPPASAVPEEQSADEPEELEPEPEVEKVEPDTDKPANDASQQVAPETPKVKPAPPPKPSTARKAINDAAKKPAATGSKKSSPALIGGGVLAVALLAAGGWYFAGGGSSKGPDASLVDVPGALDGGPVAPVDIEAAGGIAAAMASLAEDAEKAGAPAAALKELKTSVDQLAKLEDGLTAMPADAAKARKVEVEHLAGAASAKFASALQSDAEGRIRRLVRDLPWADPRSTSSAASQTPDKRGLATAIRTSLTRIRSSAASAASATTPEEALTSARSALVGSSTYKAAIGKAYRAGSATTDAAATEAAPAIEEAVAPAPSISEPAASNEPATDAQRRQLASAISGARDIANRVIRMGERPAPGADASKKEKDGHLIRQANVKTARDYQKYLDTLENSMRGTRTKVEADQLIAGANQTRTYLAQLVAGSQATLN